jgi:hypothetical protein
MAFWLIFDTFASMKVFVPPFVGFVVFGIIVLLQSIFYPTHLGDMGKGNLHAFMACFYYCWPIYFITALLTQGLIAIPVWRYVEDRSMLAKDVAVIIICSVCFLFAAGIAYIIWDKNTGRLHLAWLASIMLMIQFMYWIINSFVMLMLEGKVKVKVKVKMPIKRKAKKTQASTEQ